jgi:uncharacterized damage-inducible protein DinB
VKHLSGSLDRLLTYARGEALTAAQVAYLEAERMPGEPAADAGALVRLTESAIERALAQVRATSDDRLLEPRRVGRRGLPSTVIGLLFHAAEHATRHAGQIITSARLCG